jgi:hypothetical protein
LLILKLTNSKNKRGENMGTRSLTVFFDSVSKHKKEIAVLYGQWDGDPGGHGLDLAEFLRGIQPTEGLGGEKTANGIHCLAAQVIAHFKKEPGGFYLYPAGTRGMDEEFIYIVTIQDLTVRVLVQDGEQHQMFKGNAQEFYTWAVEKGDFTPLERT